MDEVVGELVVLPGVGETEAKSSLVRALTDRMRWKCSELSGECSCV